MTINIITPPQYPEYDNDCWATAIALASFTERGVFDMDDRISFKRAYFKARRRFKAFITKDGSLPNIFLEWELRKHGFTGELEVYDEESPYNYNLKEVLTLFNSYDSYLIIRVVSEEDTNRGHVMFVSNNNIYDDIAEEKIELALESKIEKVYFKFKK